MWTIILLVIVKVIIIDVRIILVVELARVCQVIVSVHALWQRAIPILSKGWINSIRRYVAVLVIRLKQAYTASQFGRLQLC